MHSKRETGHQTCAEMQTSGAEAGWSAAEVIASAWQTPPCGPNFYQRTLINIVTSQRHARARQVLGMMYILSGQVTGRPRMADRGISRVYGHKPGLASALGHTAERCSIFWPLAAAERDLASSPYVLVRPLKMFL